MRPDGGHTPRRQLRVTVAPAGSQEVCGHQAGSEPHPRGTVPSVDFSGGRAPQVGRADLELAGSRTRRRLIATCVGIVAAMQVAVVALLVTVHRHRFVAAVVVEAITFAIVGLVLVVVRWPRLGLGEPSVLLGVDRSTRRTVSKAVQRGKAVEDPQLASLAVDAAEQMRRRRWMVWLWLVVAVFQVPALLDRRTSWGRGLGIVVIAVFLGNAGLWWWLTRRANAAKAANEALVNSDVGTDRPGTTI